MTNLGAAAVGGECAPICLVGMRPCSDDDKDGLPTCLCPANVAVIIINNISRKPYLFWAVYSPFPSPVSGQSIFCILVVTSGQGWVNCGQHVCVRCIHERRDGGHFVVKYADNFNLKRKIRKNFLKTCCKKKK